MSLPTGSTAWLMLAAGDDREHGGNDGYDDDPQSHYSWDDTVQNHAAPAVGDVIVLWDKEILLGASVIQHIDKDKMTKDLYRCPKCGKADIKPRARKTPRYKCYECKHVFNDAKVVTKDVTTYRTRHEPGWVDLTGRLIGSQLRELCVHPKSQLSLRQLDYGRFRLALQGMADDVRLSPVETALVNLVDGHRRSLVRVRVGQSAFRRRMLDRYGNECAFMGASPVDALEAAHLYSYSASGVHHDDGGLLLRRDVHRLFDVGHLAVRPMDLVIDVSREIRRYVDYGRLHGRSLPTMLSTNQVKWVHEHWAMHRL